MSQVIPAGKVSQSELTDLVLYSDAGKEITLKINTAGKVIGTEIYFNNPRPLSDFLIESNLVQGISRIDHSVPVPKITAQSSPVNRSSYHTAQKSVPFQTYRTRSTTIVSKPCCDE